MMIPLLLQFLAPMDVSFVAYSAAMFTAGGISHGLTYNVGRFLLPDRRI